MVFAVGMYRCESWTIKKAEHWRIDAFTPWYWIRLLRVPWTARTNQSILNKISPEYSLEGLMVKLHYFDHLMWRTNSMEKTQMLGKTEDRRQRGKQNEMVGCHHRFNRHELGQTLGDGEGQGSLACYIPWGRKESDMTWRLNNNAAWLGGKKFLSLSKNIQNHRSLALNLPLDFTAQSHHLRH